MNTRVYNFHNVKTGTIVRRSPHWKREHFDPDTKQLGIVQSKEFYADGNGHVIAWPVILWEGSFITSIVHPVNVVPWRPKDYNKNNFIIMKEI